MKKILINLSIPVLAVLLLAGFVIAANTFPTTLNDWESGETIESAWADAIEAKIGADSSAVTTSLDYLLTSTSSTDPGHLHSIVGTLSALEVTTLSTASAYFMVSEAASGDGDFFIITGDGDVGINDITPDATLEVVSTSGSDVFMITSSSDGDMFIVDSSGNVGINDSTPTSRLDVDGGIRSDMVTGDPCGGSDFPEGTMFYNDTSNYYCYCDGTNDVKMNDPSTGCF